MHTTNPNKEIIRRICTLFHIRKCWMLNQTHTNTEPVKLLVELEIEKKAAFQQELKDWSGMDFTIYTLQSEPNLINAIKTNGIILLPLAKNSGLSDIKKRQNKRMP